MIRNTPVDLDALERQINHELEAYSTRTNTFALARVHDLIAELRWYRQMRLNVIAFLDAKEAELEALK